MQVISGGTTAFDAVLYPETNPVNQLYIENQLSQFSQSLNDAGRRFLEGTRQIYEQVNSSEAVHIARTALRAAKGIFHPNHIAPLTTLTALQDARPVMQRWIMAQPDLRQLYQSQQCAGYPDVYYDLYPRDCGESHYDYRRVMDAMVQENAETGEWFVRYYPDDLVEGDRALLHGEKVDILSTWDVVQLFIDAKEDPSNPFGGKL